MGHDAADGVDGTSGCGETGAQSYAPLHEGRVTEIKIITLGIFVT